MRSIFKSSDFSNSSTSASVCADSPTLPFQPCSFGYVCCSQAKSSCHLPTSAKRCVRFHLSESEMSARVGVFTSSIRKLSHGTRSLQRVEKAAFGTRDFRLHRLWMRSLGALLSALEWMPQIGVATFTISVFHGRHETAFDLAVIRRVSRCNGARHDKLRSGGQGDK